MSEDQDWRLKAELNVEAEPSMLERVVRRVRSPDVAKEVGEDVPHDAVVTHDGNLLFVYAARRPALDAARRALEAVLRRERIEGRLSVSHWDERFDEWLQLDPPLTASQKHAEEVAEQEAEKVESRTMVASTGKAVRAEVEQTMRESADRLGLRCEIIEHPHLLSTQVAFTVTGARRKIEEFAQGLRAVEGATMRAERAVMISPL